MDLKKLLPLLGITIFLYLIFLIGPDKIIAAVLSANPALLFVALLFVIPITMLQAFKWFLLVKQQGLKISFFEILKIYFIGLFYGAVTPGKIGSFIRISYLSKKTAKPISFCASSVFLDRIADILSIFLISLFGFFVFIKIFTDTLLSVAVFVIGLLVLLFFFSRKTKVVLSFLLAKIIPTNFKEKSGEMIQNFYSSFPSKRQRLVLVLLSLTAWLLVFIQAYIVATAFGINVPFFDFIGLVALSSVIGLLPVTINGHGTTEAALILFFSLFGVAAGNVFVFSVVDSLMLTYLTAFIGFLFSLKNR